MEVEALKDGVKKHGSGKWMLILTDPEFGPKLINRNNVNLKVFHIFTPSSLFSFN